MGFLDAGIRANAARFNNSAFARNATYVPANISIVPFTVRVILTRQTVNELSGMVYADRVICRVNMADLLEAGVDAPQPHDGNQSGDVITIVNSLGETDAWEVVTKPMLSHETGSWSFEVEKDLRFRP